MSWEWKPSAGICENPDCGKTTDDLEYCRGRRKPPPMGQWLDDATFYYLCGACRNDRAVRAKVLNEDPEDSS